MTPMIYEEKVNKERIHFDAFLLGVYFLSISLDFIPIFEGSVSKYIALLPVGYMLLFKLKHLKVHMSVAILMALYVFLNYYSATYALNYFRAKDRTIALFLNFSLIILCSSIDRNKREINFFKKCMIISGWLMLILTFIYSDEIGNGRLIVKINGANQDPNYFCGYLIFTILHYLENLLNKRKRFFSVISLGIFFTVVLLTGSRGGLLAVVGACLVMILCQKTNKVFVTRIITILLVGVILLFAVNTFLPEEVKERYSIEFTKEDGGASRFRIWESLIKDYKNSSDFNKLFGKGAANVAFYTHRGNVGHNLWLETRCELGVVGLTLLIIIYSIFIRKSYRLKEKIYFSTLMGYMAMTMSLSLYHYKPIFAMFLLVSIMFDYEKDENFQ